MFCPNCGTENADDAAFCPTCGTKLNSAAPNPPSFRPTRSVIDSLPNVAEDVAKPILIATQALLVFKMAAYFWGGANRVVLANLFNCAILPLAVMLFGALANGLRRAGSRAAGPAGVMACAFAAMVPAVIIEAGIGLVMGLDKGVDAAMEAVTPPSVVIYLAFLTAFVAAIAFVRRVKKDHDGQLRRFAGSLIALVVVYVLTQAVVGTVEIWIVGGAGAGVQGVVGVAWVFAHGFVLTVLARMLARRPDSPEEDWFQAKKLWKKGLVFVLVLLVCALGMSAIPKDVNQRQFSYRQLDKMMMTRGALATKRANAGRNVAIAVINANIEREASSPGPIWPKFTDDTENAAEYFKPLFRNGWLEDLDRKDVAGWSVFVPENRYVPDDTPFLVSSNLKRSGNGSFYMDSDDPVLGGTLLVVTRDGHALTGEQAKECFNAAVRRSRYKLLPAK